MKRTPVLLALLAASSGAGAIEWNPSGELGLVITNGNTDTSSINGKAALKGEDERWVHDFYLAALRGEVEDQVTASRYEAGAKSGWKFSDRSYVFGSLRYENDDFSAYETQAALAVGYGWYAIRNDATSLLFEAGPGYKRVEPVGTGESEGEVIGRGFVDFKHRFNESTQFYNTLLAEAGSDNTFAQDDLGLQVAMSDTLALKAGFQVRHNSDVPPAVDKTDTLTTLNVVWSPE